MALITLLEGLQASPLGRAIAESSFLFPALESVHVMAVVTVVGAILVVDLRLLGASSREQAVTVVSHQFLPWTWGAFGLAVVTGSLLFVSRAADYAAIPAFYGKFFLMGLAGVNMAAFHLVTWRKVAAWDLGPTPVAARMAGALSLAFWAGIVLLGRQVGFSL